MRIILPPLSSPVSPIFALRSRQVFGLYRFPLIHGLARVPEEPTSGR